MNRFGNFESKSSLRELQNCQLDIAIKFKELCEKNNIKYYLAGPTLISASIASSFLPWEDGICFAMMREDHERFLDISKNELEAPYSIQTVNNTKDTYQGGFTYMRNDNTTCIVLKDIHSESSQGVWIYIAPIDYTFDNINKRKNQHKMVSFNQKLIYANVYDSNKDIPSIVRNTKKIFRSYAKSIDINFTIKKLNKWIYKAGKTNTLTSFIYTDRVQKYVCFDKSILDKQIDIELNGVSFKTIEKYKSFLDLFYGEDWFKLPDRSNRVPKSDSYFVDVNTPYNENIDLILRDTSFIKNDIPNYNELINKTIIIFGEEEVISEFIKFENEMFRPTFIISDDVTKIGQKFTVNEYNVYEICDVHRIDQDKRIVIICSNNYIEKAKMLQQIGINECLVYCADGLDLEWPIENCRLTYCINGYPVIYKK